MAKGEFEPKTRDCAFVKVHAKVFRQKLSLSGGEPQDARRRRRSTFCGRDRAPRNHSPPRARRPWLSLDLRVELGRYWLRLLKAKLPAAKAAAAIKKFKDTSLLHFRTVEAGTVEEQVTHAAALANQPYLQMLSALSGGRALDGWQLFQQLQTHKASNFLPQADGAVDQLGEDFKKWVTDTFPTLARSAPSGWNASGWSTIRLRRAQ